MTTAWTDQQRERHLEECPDVGEIDVTTVGQAAPEVLRWCQCGEADRHSPMAEVNAHAWVDPEVDPE